MSEDKSERTDKLPSGCPSPAKPEKTDSSSSRQSGSPLHWEFEPWNHSGRIRPSSWDDSDDDLSPKPELSASKPSRIYSSESNACKGSISSEINELKKQFFYSLENSGSNDSVQLESLKERLEMKLKCDRRQSPARVRRRSRSSSSSSPVPETQNSPDTKDKGTGPDSEFDDSDGTSPRTLGMDSRHYLNNFFSELRLKRISMLDSVPVTEKIGKDSVLICDNMKLEMLNELNASDLNEDGGYFCKTSRKLSQILEVEENKKDLERSSEESIEKVELFTKDFEKLDEGDSLGPLQTARSKTGQKFVLQNAGDSRQKKTEGYRSLSFEEFGNFQKVSRVSHGSLSERSGRIFEPKIDEEFIHLCAKTGKTQLSSPKLTEIQDIENSLQFLCFADPLGANQNFSVEIPPMKEDKEKNSNRSDYLNKMEKSGSSTSRKSTDRSEQSPTNRTKSGQSRKSSNPQSPRFALNIGGDSARSMRADDVHTSRSQSKSREKKAVSESKRPSSEECSGRNSTKSSFRSDDTCEYRKTDRNLHLTLESPSVKSAQSSRSFSEQRIKRTSSKSVSSNQKSQRTGKGPSRAASVECTPTGQNLKTENSEISPAKSTRSPEKTNTISCRSDSSKKTPKSSKTPEESFRSRASDPKTPRSHKIPELGLPIEIITRPESQKASSRSRKSAELDNDIRDANQSQSLTDRPSDHSAGSRNGSKRLRKSTPRSRSATSGSNSVRSKDNSENREGKTPNLFFSEEYESACDVLNNQTPVSAATKKSSNREIDTPSQQPSCRSESPTVRKTFTPRPDSSSERPFGSRKSSARSVHSREKTPAGYLENVSPSKSETAKSRAASWTSLESKFADGPFDVEKLDIDVRSGRTTNRSFNSEYAEEKEEHRSSPGSRSGPQSGRQSDNRLSIINEVTFEDFESSTEPFENEEKDLWEKSRPPSRRSRNRASPKSVGTISEDVSKVTAESFEEELRNESSPRDHPLGREMWTELIQTFEGTQKSSLFSEKNFPGFPVQKEEDSAMRSVYPTMTETSEKLYDDVTVEDSFKLSGKARTPKSERKEFSERASSDQEREEDFSFSLVYRDSFVEKIKIEEERSLHTPQNLYYVEVDKGGPFGIGEFGDVTRWNGGESDFQDPNKPKDHGDGSPAFKSTEVLVRRPEKREKETKNQRQLWTELKEDFRERRLFSNDQLQGIEIDTNEFVPICLKTSKSDNCISRKPREGSQSAEVYDCENNRREDVTKSTANMPDRFGSGSVNSEMAELECDRTPRLSRSLSDLVTQLPLERYKSNELSESRNSSRAPLFEKPHSRSEKNDPGSLDIFLARKKEEDGETEPNNWLHIKAPDRKKSDRWGKKAKTKMKKGGSLPREPSVGYLNSRKSQRSVPGLKLRNSNCFQNFYKRFISVFCVTSNSSAATSK